MLTDTEIDDLHGIFYNEAPYDYILSIEKRERKYHLGSCNYEQQICRLYAPDNYMRALFTMLHEIAHARIQHKTHSDMWAKEFARLLEYHKYPKDLAREYGVMEPHILRYVNS